jgi:hypothetical protein
VTAFDQSAPHLLDMVLDAAEGGRKALLPDHGDVQRAPVRTWQHHLRPASVKPPGD